VATLIDGDPVVSVAVSVDERPAKVRVSKSIRGDSAVAILFVLVVGVEGAQGSGKDQSVVVCKQAEEGDATRDVGDASPLVGRRAWVPARLSIYIFVSISGGWRSSIDDLRPIGHVGSRLDVDGAADDDPASIRIVSPAIGSCVGGVSLSAQSLVVDAEGSLMSILSSFLSLAVMNLPITQISLSGSSLPSFLLVLAANLFLMLLVLAVLP